MNSESKIKKLIASLKAKKHIEIVIAVVAVVIMLVLYFSTKTADKNTDSAAPVKTYDYCERVERELTEALEAMKGVGKTKTVICWESSVEKVIAYATSNSGNSVSATPTIVQAQGVSSPVVLKELYPKALGVIIICQGGGNVSVKLDVMNAVAALLNISQNNVNVYAMK